MRCVGAACTHRPTRALHCAARGRRNRVAGREERQQQSRTCMQSNWRHASCQSSSGLSSCRCRRLLLLLRPPAREPAGCGCRVPAPCTRMLHACPCMYVLPACVRACRARRTPPSTTSTTATRRTTTATAWPTAWMCEDAGISPQHSTLAWPGCLPRRAAQRGAVPCIARGRVLSACGQQRTWRSCTGSTCVGGLQRCGSAMLAQRLPIRRICSGGQVLRRSGAQVRAPCLSAGGAR